MEQNQLQTFFSLVARLLQLTYDAMLDRLIQEEKLNGRHGGVIQHPSQENIPVKRWIVKKHDFFITMKQERKLT